MADKTTIDVYDAQTETYRALVADAPENGALAQFMALVPENGLVLDYGCGVGNAANIMGQHGFSVVGTDASAQMVAAARDLYGVTARHATFSDLNDVNHYDGVWANFSLLHAPRAEIGGHLAAVFTALHQGGYFYLALKTGTGEARDKLGRLYAYYSEGEMRETLANAGFEIVDAVSGSSLGLAGDVEDWFGLFCRKPA